MANLSHKKKWIWIRMNDNGTQIAKKINASVTKVDDNTYIYFDANSRKWVLTDRRTGLKIGTESRSLNYVYESYTQNSDDIKTKVENIRKQQSYEEKCEQLNILINIAEKGLIKHDIGKE